MGDTPVDAYDGDTPADERRAIRMRAGVVFTNPDMLHTAILPNEEQWRTFFAALRVVVVDELHVYSGTFGTHVAFVLRRLRRLEFLSLMGNPIAREKHYRTFVVWRMPHLRVLDYRRITERVRTSPCTDTGTHACTARI